MPFAITAASLLCLFLASGESNMISKYHCNKYLMPSCRPLSQGQSLDWDQLSLGAMQANRANVQVSITPRYNGCLPLTCPLLPTLSAKLTYYNVLPNSPAAPQSSTFCFTISSKGRARCFQEYGVYQNLNTTRCCEAGFTKFKFWPSKSASSIDDPPD
jgi:hypothetical protein